LLKGGGQRRLTALSALMARLPVGAGAPESGDKNPRAATEGPSFPDRDFNGSNL
jgi:hypothetical protein